MNSSIRIGAIGSLFLMVILLINLSWVQVFHEDEYARNPRNARNFVEAKQIERGQISAGGQILAQSFEDDQGLYQRSYPNMPVSFAPVVGYLSDQFGAAGLEQGFNANLNGETHATGSRFLRTTEKRVGDSLELTLDPQTQATAFDQLDNRGYEGAVVALRPSTGEVLAMASSPSYDPNAVVNPDGTAANAAWESITSNPGNPLLNHAAQEQLPPGSIFKIITTAAGLENGYTPDSQLTAEAAITLPGTEVELTNYGGRPCGGGGQTTLHQAFTLSCNTAFVQMATEMGDGPLREAATAFGVGEKYDLGLPNAAGSLGGLEDLGAVGQSAIGQRDVTMTALQAAVMAATVANDGRRMEPQVVQRIVSPKMKTVRDFRARQVTEAISPDIAAQLKDLMRSSERNTHGYNGNNYASKTGTAEHGEELAPHTWYVAFDEDKDVAVAVVVKNGGGMGESATGGQIAAPIGRTVLATAPGAGDQQGGN